MMQRPRPSNNLTVAGIIAAGLLVSTLVVAWALREFTQSVSTSIDRANPVNAVRTVLPEATPTIVVRPPNIVQVRALAELATSSMLLSTVVEAQKARVGNVIYERLLLIACGRVKAGVDLSRMREGDIIVSPDGRKVTVRLSTAEVQDAYLIDDATAPCTTKVYDRTNLLVIGESKELEGQAREQALKAIRDMAIQAGVLKEANRNAQVVLERMLQSAGFEQVEVIITP